MLQTIINSRSTFYEYFLKKKNEALFLTVEKIFSQILKKKNTLATVIIQNLPKKAEKINELRAKIKTAQESFQRGKRCMEVWPLVLAPRARAPRKNVSEEPQFARSFFHEKAYNFTVVLLFFRTFDVIMTTLEKNF